MYFRSVEINYRRLIRKWNSQAWSYIRLCFIDRW